MDIGIIGSGNMGRTLGVRLAQLGHQVFFGARRRDQAEVSAVQAGYGASAGTNEDAARFGAVLIWTMREANPASVLADPAVLDGKIVLDLNNRDYAVDARSGGWFGEAIAERLQAAAPNARVVKAFNTIAMDSFGATPESLRGAGAQTFLAGADGEAKSIVARLAGELGFEAIDLGTSAASFRAAEALGDIIRLLMIYRGMGGRAHLRVTQLPEPVLGVIGSPQASRYD